MIFRRNKQRWDPQPTQPAGVVVASDGTREISTRAVARAAALAAELSCPATVVIVARIHGTQFGLPHPGLMPSKQELLARVGWVEHAVSTLKRSGVDADGQVASTRHAVKSIAKIARVRGASVVVIDAAATTGVRKLIEGDPGSELRRRFKRSKDPITVEIVPTAVPSRGVR